MSNYVPVLGLEIHVELNTKSKMFCRCSADYFGKPPNTHTCPVCLGLPGALPFINQEALNKCLMIGLALGCNVSEQSRFERKNYFYPDLPKGYQISQYRWPLCINGQFSLSDGTKIRINRVHQEEDTGKLSHIGGETGVDFNRSGVPLVEVVTEPDFSNSEQVREFAKKLQQLFRYLGVSGADMEKGDMRLEANVSLRPENVEGLPDYRIELKNINSFSFMAQAIEYEISRQSDALDKGEVLIQETRGWDQDKKATYLQRSKEAAHDYRYFPEPDLPEIRFQKSDVGLIKESLPELPWEAEKKLVERLGVSESDARILVEDAKLLIFVEEAIELAIIEQLPVKELVNLVINKKIDPTKITPKQLVDEIIQKKSNAISDDTQIEGWAKEIISENPEIVSDYRSGKLTAIQALIGAVMRKSEGKAEANLVKITLEKLLS